MRTAWDVCVTLWVAAASVAGISPGDGWQVPSVAGFLMLVVIVPLAAGVLFREALGQMKPEEPRYASL